VNHSIETIEPGFKRCLDAKENFMPSPQRLLLIMISLCPLASLPQAGVGGPIDNPKYGLVTTHGPDSTAGGWMINLGITGIRVRLEPDAPEVLSVGHVFPDSPASGRLEIGDIITGTGSQMNFSTAHKFGYGMDKFGYEGPLMEFSETLEACQGVDGTGRMRIHFIRDGEVKQVMLEIGKAYGNFSKSYPFECKKTDRILAELLPYIAKRQLENGTWGDRQHINAFAALALLASGDERYRDHTRKAARAFAARTSDVIDYTNYDCWTHSLYGIYLGEYYLATREEWVLSELEEINRWLPRSQMGNGGWGHRPAERPGGNGYGAINILAMQCKMAWALIERCGLQIDEEGFTSAHRFAKRGTNALGYVWYADSLGGDGYADMGRTGAASIAHGLAAERPGYSEYALRSARCIGANPDTFCDTHGSPILGMGWTALGAAIDQESFRRMMDENRWWFSLAQCNDGTFYYQPNRDNNPQDYEAAPRLSASAVTALILCMKDRKLAMMNLDVGSSESASVE
tara:strand:- start:742 stop:2289 length:1548 start_codon:yes stop_codon:yes gene_type:complete